MPLDLPSFKKSLKTTFNTLNKSQAEALAVEIAANYTAGRTAAETHQSIKSAGNLAAASPEAPEAPEEEGLTTEEKAEIALLVALFLGYIKEFNSRAQDQILTRVTTMEAEGKTMDEIQGYVDDVLSGRENIIIDNTGQERKELYLDKNLKLSEVTTTVTKPYHATVLTYAALTAANAAHSSYEAGRKASLIAQNYNQWVFVGPADERARPWHVAILGEIYTYGTIQSEYAERCLGEPHCRHRAQVWYNNPDKDTAPEVWQKLKDDSGLHWDTDTNQWTLKDKIKVTKPDIDTTIRKYETKIKDRKTEKAFIFDKKGNIILEKAGYKDGVNFTNDELKTFKNKILTHNHPGEGMSFSIEDIRLACESNLNEMRATTKNGSFIMKMADGSNFNNKIFNEKISDTFEKYREQEIKQHLYRIQDTTRKVKITEEESLAVASKKIWLKTTREIPELQYNFVEWE